MADGRRKKTEKIPPMTFFFAEGKIYIFVPRSLWKKGREGDILCVFKNTTLVHHGVRSELYINLRQAEETLSRRQKYPITELTIWPENSSVRIRDTRRRHAGWVKVGSIRGQKVCCATNSPLGPL
jgi:hypothetical protein